MAANAHRGEVALILAGNEYRLRPTFDVLARMESATGEGILALARKLAEGEMALVTLATLLHASIAEQANMTVAQLGEALTQQGVAEGIAALGAIFAMALEGRPREE